MKIARICGDIVYWHMKLNYMNILVYNTQVNYGLSRWRYQHNGYIKKKYLICHGNIFGIVPE